MPVSSARRRTTRPARALAVVAVALLLLAPAALPAAAKMFLEARLDAPISFESPPGEHLLVGVTVTVPEGLEDHWIEGTPVWLVLTGPKGDTTEAKGTIDAGSGHYAFRIEVPAGGPRSLEVVARDGAGVPVFLMEDPFTFRPVGPTTAQLAAAPAPAVVTPQEPVVPPAAAPAVVDPAATTSAAPAPPALAVALAGLGLLVGAVAFLVARSARRVRAVDLPPRAPGA
jgi:hypothetical protein